MIRIVRRVRLLTVLALLFSGLLQPLGAAQGVACARSHAPAEAAQQVDGSAIDGDTGPGSLTLVAVLDADHQHSQAPGSDDAQASSAHCGAAAVSSGRSSPSLIAVARSLLPRTDQVPARLLGDSLFRPPRLS